MLNVNFKDTFKNVFKIKDFHIYLIIYAMFSTLNSIVNNANSKEISSWWILTSFLAFIPIGYLLNIIHNKINDKSEITENFKQTIGNSILTALKGFIAVSLNSILYGITFAILFVGCALISNISKVNLDSQPVYAIFNPVHYPLMFLFLLFTIVFMYCIFNFIPIIFSEKLAIADTFNLKKIFSFFKSFKKTFIVLLIFGVIMLILFLSTAFVGVGAALLVQKANLHPFLGNILGVSVIFICALFGYIIHANVYLLLSDIYKELKFNNSEKTEEVENEINDDKEDDDLNQL